MKTTRDVYVHVRGEDYMHVRLTFDPLTPAVHSASSNNPAPLHEALMQCSQIISNALRVLRDEHLGK